MPVWKSFSAAEKENCQLDRNSEADGFNLEAEEKLEDPVKMDEEGEDNVKRDEVEAEDEEALEEEQESKERRKSTLSGGEESDSEFMCIELEDIRKDVQYLEHIQGRNGKEDADIQSWLINFPNFEEAPHKYCDISMGDSHKYKAELPKAFVVHNGLQNLKSPMYLEDPRGYKWEMTLGYKNGQSVISRNWKNHCVANGLEFNHTYKYMYCGLHKSKPLFRLCSTIGIKTEILQKAKKVSSLDGTSWQTDNDKLRTENSSLKEELKTLQDKYEIVCDENSSLKEKFEKVAEEEINQCKIGELKDRIKEMENQLLEGELERKKLHNKIVDLKGNIRVFCRVRPDNGGKDVENVITYHTSTKTRGKGLYLNNQGKTHSFIFDKVFNHEASQEDVFSEISELVQSALDGYKVCIFAYGQTGSGKTYTMMGRHEAPEQNGVIPRAMEQIFQAIQSIDAQGWKYKMQVSIFEIYNETVRDLLSTDRINGNNHVSDFDVCSIANIHLLLDQADQRRSVGKTQMNEQSSRSHYVFKMRISGVNERTHDKVEGVLNLIDLAGSERLSKSGVEGNQLKETQHINKILLALSNVISALATNKRHVPYRDSKLTLQLQPCLGGDGKTLLFVNISPEPSSTQESLSTLNFAKKVIEVKLAKAPSKNPK